MIYNIQGSKMKFDYGGAIFAYICIIALFNYFIIHKNGSIMDAFLLGLLTYGIFEGTKIVGKPAANEDFSPGLESSKTIELFLFIPLNLIAFK